MSDKLSLVSVVLFIALGALVLLILFFFAKRQITRFTLKSSRQPHEAIGRGAPKAMQKEILRRLKHTDEIKFEPPLIHDRCEAKPNSLKEPGYSCNYKYRMLAVDAFSSIDLTLAKLIAGHPPRHPNVPVRKYLIALHHKGPLLGASMQLIQEYADAYEHARHSPQVFGQDEYKEYIELLQQIISCLQTEFAAEDIRSPEKVDTEVFFSDSQSGAPVETRTVPVANDSNKPGVIQGMQTRLRGSGRQTSPGDQQALLDSMSSTCTRSSEDRSDQEDSYRHNFTISENRC